MSATGRQATHAPPESGRRTVWPRGKSLKRIERGGRPAALRHPVHFGGGFDPRADIARPPLRIKVASRLARERALPLDLATAATAASPTFAGSRPARTLWSGDLPL